MPDSIRTACPHCAGRGTELVRSSLVPCDYCKGTKEVTVEDAGLYERVADRNRAAGIQMQQAAAGAARKVG